MLQHWPEVPENLRRIGLKLPPEFRMLAADPSFTNEEIGRIVRCLAVSTDYFLTPRIEPEVLFYGKKMEMAERTRQRVKAYRERVQKCGQECENGGSAVSTTPKPLSSSEKTPTILEEEKPPIVPLEKKTSSFLEKNPPCRRERKKRHILEDARQMDIFSLATDGFGTASTETGQERPQELAAASGGPTGLQDIERDSRAVLEGSKGMDTRVDAAWIPQQFGLFWAKYPRKVAKQDALKAFTKLIKQQEDVDKFMAVLMASLDYWKEQDNWKKENGKFIPYPATWLNRGSWEDSKDNDVRSSRPEFLAGSEESDDELIKRMEGR